MGDPSEDHSTPPSHLSGCTTADDEKQSHQLSLDWHTLEEHTKTGSPQVQKAFKNVRQSFNEDPFSDLLGEYLDRPTLRHTGMQTDRSLLKDVGVQTDILSDKGPQITEGTPAPSYMLTKAEFSAIVDALTSSGQAQKLVQFQEALDMTKDMGLENTHSPRARADAILTHYLEKPDSSKEKLLSALRIAGLTLPAELVSLSSKQ